MRILSLGIVLWIGTVPGCAIPPDASRLAGTWIAYGGDSVFVVPYTKLDYRPGGPSHLVMAMRSEGKRAGLLVVLDDFTAEGEAFSVRATCAMSEPDDGCSGEAPERWSGRFLGPGHLELRLGSADAADRLWFVRPDTLQRWQRKAAEVEKRYLESLQESRTQ